MAILRRSFWTLLALAAVVGCKSSSKQGGNSPASVNQPLGLSARADLKEKVGAVGSTQKSLADSKGVDAGGGPIGGPPGGQAFTTADGLLSFEIPKGWVRDESEDDNEFTFLAKNTAGQPLAACFIGKSDASISLDELMQTLVDSAKEKGFKRKSVTASKVGSSSGKLVKLGLTKGDHEICWDMLFLPVSSGTIIVQVMWGTGTSWGTEHRDFIFSSLKLSGKKTTKKDPEEEPAEEADPESAEELTRKACALFDKGDFKAAIKAFTAAIEKSPKTASLYCDRGSCHFNLKIYKKAVPDYTQAIKLDPKFAFAYKYRGFASYNLQQWEACIKDCEKAIKLKPDWKEEIQPVLDSAKENQAGSGTEDY